MPKSIKVAIVALALTLSGIGIASAASNNCYLELNLKSYDSGQVINVTITNYTNSYRSVSWIDHTGTPVQYIGLNAGQSYVQPTLVGHAWMFTNGPGDCKQITIPQKGATSIDIRN